MTGIAVTILAVLAFGVSPSLAQGIHATAASVREPAQANDSSSTPLFESHDLLTLTIEAPFKTIIKDRKRESAEHPGVLSYEDPQGDIVRVPVEIKTRGNTRLRRNICGFPPLRLDFSRNQILGTQFANQDKLKLVTHCQNNRSEYEQYVLQEYLVYRLYNVLTALSFRVRLAHITYIDTESERDKLTRYAFLIEDEDRMAARNGWQVISPPVVPPEALDPVQLNLLEVFQYMIGNPDWSAFMREPDRETCCHNTKPIGLPHGPVFPVPYDFDITGLVYTRYADQVFEENLDRMNIRSVRERRYKGICASEPHLRGSLEVFNEHQEAIYALYREQEGLEDKVLRRSLEYLDEFYEVIGDPDEVRKQITRRCRRL